MRGGRLCIAGACFFVFDGEVEYNDDEVFVLSCGMLITILDIESGKVVKGRSEQRQVSLKTQLPPKARGGNRSKLGRQTCSGLGGTAIVGKKSVTHSDHMQETDE